MPGREKERTFGGLLARAAVAATVLAGCAGNGAPETGGNLPGGEAVSAPVVPTPGPTPEGMDVAGMATGNAGSGSSPGDPAPGSAAAPTTAATDGEDTGQQGEPGDGSSPGDPAPGSAATPTTAATDGDGNGQQGAPGSGVVGDFAIEPVAFEVDGVQVRGHLYEPQGVAEPAASVVMAHGLGMIAAGGLGPFAERFAEVGLHVLVFDYRGFGESASGSTPTQLISTDMQLDDWRAAIEFLRSTDGLDPDRIVLWGTSFSGGHVLSLGGEDGQLAAVLAQVPHVNAAASSLAASGTADWLNLFSLANQDAALPPEADPIMVPIVGDPGQAALMTQPGSKEGYLRLLPPQASWVNETPARFVLDFGAYSPDAVAAQSEAPTLIIVATDDTVTPPDPARQLAAAMGATLLEVRGGHFDVYAGDNFDIAIEAQLSFLDSEGLTRQP